MQPQDFDKLHDYHWGRLSPEERTKLEARLATDPELREAWEQECLLFQAVKNLGDRRLKAALGDEERFLRNEDRLRPQWAVLKLLILAAIVGALVLLYFLFT